jgi:hypothetical protein
MAPPSEALAERETIPAPAPDVFDDAPAWAKALYLSAEETRAALTEIGAELASHRATMGRLSYRMGALSIAMGLQEHRTRELEARAVVIPMRGN